MRPWPARLRPNRVELNAVLVLTGLMITLAAIAIVRLVLYGIPAACFGPDAAGAGACEPYLAAMSAYSNELAAVTAPATIGVLLLPMLGALVLGLALLGRELEQQTTTFAWSLSPSRGAWLRQRLLIVLPFLVAICLLAGALADVIAGLRQPMLDQSHNFEALGTRGPALAGAGLLVFGVALHAGAVLGRQLPALLLSGALIVPGFLGTSWLTDQWLRNDAQIAEWTQVGLGDRTLDSLIRTPDGEVIDWEEAYNRYGQAMDQIGGEESGFTIMTRYVPAALYPTAVLRITAVLGAIGLLATALTFWVINRRRP